MLVNRSYGLYLVSPLISLLLAFFAPVRAALAFFVLTLQLLYRADALEVPGRRRVGTAPTGFHWGVYVVLVLIVILIFAMQAFIAQYMTGLTAWLISVIVGALIATFILFMVGHGPYGARPGAGSR